MVGPSFGTTTKRTDGDALRRAVGGGSGGKGGMRFRLGNVPEWAIDSLFLAAP